MQAVYACADCYLASSMPCCSPLAWPMRASQATKQSNILQSVLTSYGMESHEAYKLCEMVQASTNCWSSIPCLRGSTAPGSTASMKCVRSSPCGTRKRMMSSFLSGPSRYAALGTQVLGTHVLNTHVLSTRHPCALHPCVGTRYPCAKLGSVRLCWCTQRVLTAISCKHTNACLSSLQAEGLPVWSDNRIGDPSRACCLLFACLPFLVSHWLLCAKYSMSKDRC